MANTRQLRRRIKSIKNTSQITKAMQMVAATKMRRAQNQALAGRPYSETLNFILSTLSSKVDPTTHPLLNDNSASDIGVILLSTDKGLAGALNTNLFRATQNFSKDLKNLIFYTVGRKGRNFVVKTGKNLEADFENLDVITFRQGAQLAKIVVEKFLNKQIKEVYLIYPNFISTLRQEPRVTKLLPISAKDLDNKQESRGNTEFLFEPNLNSLLQYVLVHFVETKIYQALLDTKASEHSSRMIAMQNATENAKELVEDLQLTYNQTRQEGITRELLEITTAQVALE